MVTPALFLKWMVDGVPLEPGHLVLRAVEMETRLDPDLATTLLLLMVGLNVKETIPNLDPATRDNVQDPVRGMSV